MGGARHGAFTAAHGAHEHRPRARLLRLEEQSAGRGEIDLPVGQGAHHRGARRIERLLRRPERFLTSAYANAQDCRDIQAQGGEAARRTDALLAAPGAGGDQHQAGWTGPAGRVRQRKTQSRRAITRPGRRDFMQGRHGHGLAQGLKGLIHPDPGTIAGRQGGHENI